MPLPWPGELDSEHGLAWATAVNALGNGRSHLLQQNVYLFWAHPPMIFTGFEIISTSDMINVNGELASDCSV
jgi:hypothetical protein